jgi:CDP-diacylglycerol---serine O-phosphatidyltransferase
LYSLSRVTWYGQLIWFLDGFVARLLHVHSEIGKQLDSLADMVTFGVVPGVVMFQLLSNVVMPKIPMEIMSPEGNHWTSIVQPQLGDFSPYVPYLGFLIPVFSAIRLAKFNIDTRQTDSFIGVPTPANAIFICSLPLVLEQIGYSFDMYPRYSNVSDNQWFPYGLITLPIPLMVLTLIMSFLLVAELPLFSLKFKNVTWADNKIRYIFLALSVIMLIIFKYVGIPFVIVLYIVMSVINNIVNRKTA